MAYLTFEILSSGNINWCCNNNSPTLSTIEYRKNGGEWISITSSMNGVNIGVVAGDILEFRGDNAAYSDGSTRFGMFGDGKTTAQFKAKGNIMSLINSTDFENLKSFTSNYTFRAMFNRCSTLMDISELVLPATGLTTGSYRFMFQACTSITTAPKLPATTLTSECYQGMFAGCSSLNKIECLATSITATNCTSNWVSGVSSTGLFIKNPNITTSTWGRGISKIPTNWTVQDKVLFSVEPDALGFAYSGETKTAVLESETPWTATVPSWITLSPSSGVSGSSVSLTCSANGNYGLRIGSVVFTDGNNSATLTVSQEGDKTVVLKDLYRNGSPIKMMFRNGALIYRCIEKTNQN